MLGFKIENDKNLTKTLTMVTSGIDVKVKLVKEGDNDNLYSGDFAGGEADYHLLLDRLISKYNFS